MTQHAHSQFVEGCYRCELSADEAAAAIPDLARLEELAEAYGNGAELSDDDADAVLTAAPSLLAAARERDELRAEVARIRASVGAEIESWQHHVSEDCWYTCPAATEGREGASCCNDAMEGAGCDCGLDFRRSRLRAALGTAGQEGQR